MTSRQRSLVLLVSAVLLWTAAVAYAPAQVTFTEYPGPTSPSFQGGDTVDITAGPDGNLWFTENYAFGAQTQIGRITPSGIVTYFPVPSGSSEGGITTGPDGNLWFTEYRTSLIGRSTPAGSITEFPTPTGGSFPAWIATGPDGNLWFTEFVGNNIGRITPLGVITEFPVPTPASPYGPYGITAGPDGNLWFAEPFGNNVARITPAGGITEFQVPTSGSYPFQITAGPDGNLWFTETLANNIGRITTAGIITEYPIPTPNSGSAYISVGPDGNLWFTEGYTSQIARITLGGSITEFPTPTGSSHPAGITAGPDGNLWFLEPAADKIVKASTIQFTPLVFPTQAMEGDLKLNPGDTLRVGYDFTMPGSHPSATLRFSVGQVSFAYACVNGSGAGTLVVPFGAETYSDNQNSSAWVPSGNQQDPSVFQGQLAVPDLCSGNQVRFQQGGTFTTGVCSTDSTNKVNVRWHYSGNGSAGSWSGTQSVVPAFCP